MRNTRTRSSSSGTRSRPLANLRVVSLVDFGPGGPRRTQDGVEGRQLVALTNQILQGHINNVGQVITSARRLPASARHDCLRCLAPAAHADVVADQRHVSAADGTGIIRGQAIGNKVEAGALGDVPKDGFGNFLQHHEVAQPLEGLQQDQQSNPWNRLPSTLFHPGSLKKAGGVDFIQFLRRWVGLQPRIRSMYYSYSIKGTSSARYRNGFPTGSCGVKGSTVCQLSANGELHCHEDLVYSKGCLTRFDRPAQEDTVFSRDPGAVKEALARFPKHNAVLEILNDISGALAQVQVPAATPPPATSAPSGDNTQYPSGGSRSGGVGQPQSGGTTSQRAPQTAGQQSGAGGGTALSSGTPAPLTCVSVERAAGTTGDVWGLRNRCNYDIEVRFCVQNPKSSLSCQASGAGGETSIRANAFEYALPFYGEEGQGVVLFAPCIAPAVPVNWEPVTNAHYACR